MFVIWFYTTLDPHLNKGPLWYTHQLGNPCNKYWWTNLLYINNFYPKQLIQEVRRCNCNFILLSHCKLLSLFSIDRT
jgi:hypothetical protein